MTNDEILQNISGALSLFADRASAVLQQAGVSILDTEEDSFLIDDLMNFFPMDKVDVNAGTYDQYLIDLRKTVVDNYECGNYQVAYFYAHLIFMSYAYYSIELAYSVWPDKVKDQYDLLNAYGTRNKPAIQNHSNTYAFSKIPEKEIFKVFYAIGLDVQFIQQLSSYVEKRDDYAHATGEGNISVEVFNSNISNIQRNMERLFSLFTPYLKKIYVDFLLSAYTVTYSEVKSQIADYILDHSFSIRDLDYLCNLGISDIRNENEEFRDNYRFIRKVHCAFIEYCIEELGLAEPGIYESLRNEAYLHYCYKGNAKGYVEDVLGISEYQCAKDGGEFPVYSCPECGEKQLVHDADAQRYHCFACDENYTDDDLVFCERCGALMRRNGEPVVCETCIKDMEKE